MVDENLSDSCSVLCPFTGARSGVMIARDRHFGSSFTALEDRACLRSNELAIDLLCLRLAVARQSPLCFPRLSCNWTLRAHFSLCWTIQLPAETLNVPSGSVFCSLA